MVLANMSRRLRLRLVLLVALACAMVALVVVPATVWRSPRVDESYSGFDQVLMYMDAVGGGTSAGVVTVKGESLTLAALPGSAPVVHLATSPLSFSSRFNAVVVRGDEGSSPLELSIISPYHDYRFELVFEPEPTRRVVMRRVVQGRVIDSTPLGVYTLGQEYEIRTSIDRERGSVSMQIASAAGDALFGQALYIAATSHRYESHVISARVVVKGGVEYRLSALTKPLEVGLSGLSVEWLDSKKKRISIVGDWSRASTLDGGWSARELQAVAPAEASFARVEVATAEQGQSLFGQLRLSPSNGTQVNLLKNGDFSGGSAGWRRAWGATPLVFREFRSRTFDASVTKSDWPNLFSSTRMALSLRASSSSGLSTVRLDDYHVDIAHSRWLADRVQDPVATLLVVLVGALGIAAITGSLASRMLRQRQHRAGRTAKVGQPWSLSPRPYSAASLRWMWILAAAGLFYLLGNAALAHLGSLNVDIVAARVWGYTAAHYGLADLYYLPNISSAGAGQWQGVPLQEAGFPYGGVMAYIFWLEGMAYRFLFAPLVGPPDGVVLDTVLRAMNACFALADAAVLYLIIREFNVIHKEVQSCDRSIFLRFKEVGVSSRTRILLVALFVFNPAVWYAGSVWGTTQSISLMFLLLAVWLTLRKSPTLAWGLLLAAFMTRPQNLIPGAILAVYLLIALPIRTTLRSMSWAIVGVFVLMLPLSLTVSPTLSFDTVANALFMHVGSGNDSWTLPASWGGMSIWPIVTALAGSAHGIDRILFPAESTLGGGLTYYKVGSLLLLGSMLALVAWTALRARSPSGSRQWVVWMAAAAVAMFTLNTGTPTYHYLLALALVFLTIGALPPWACFASVGTLTVTTFASMYAMGAYWLSAHPTWSVGVYDPHSGLTRFVVRVAGDDWFITACSVANLAVLALLLYYTVRPSQQARPSEAAASTSRMHTGGRELREEMR